MNTPFRQYSWLDQVCSTVDDALRTLSGKTDSLGRIYPSKKNASTLSEQERRHSAGLMRVNHTGEICAQALYHGQAAISKNKETQLHFRQAALEEGDHLTWCEKRLESLESRTSYLNPVWYAGSFLIGVTAGIISDSVSLGFVAETETQVMTHLENHLKALPKTDEESRMVLEAMHEDEAKHREEAIQKGARELPVWVKKFMHFTSKVMVKTAYYF